MAKRRIIKRVKYNGKELSRTRKKNKGFYEDILQRIELFMEYVQYNYRRAFFVRLTVTYPAGSLYFYEDDNVRFSRFIDRLNQFYFRKRYRPLYFWVRERSKTGQNHHHVTVVFDGNKINSGNGVLAKATTLWARALDYQDPKSAEGLIDISNDKPDFAYGGCMILPGSAREYYFNQLYKLLSYYAKVYSKEDIPKGVNGYGCSRLPRSILPCLDETFEQFTSSETEWDPRLQGPF